MANLLNGQIVKWLYQFQVKKFNGQIAKSS